MGFGNHTYILDGIPFLVNGFVSEDNFPVRSDELYIQWSRRTSSHKHMTTDLLSFDGTLHPAKIEHVVEGQRMESVRIVTKKRRHAVLNLRNQILTPSGYKSVNAIGIGETIVTTDTIGKDHNWYRQRIRQAVMVEALLKNHDIEYTKGGHPNRIYVGDTTYVVQDYDLEAPVVNGNVVTVGRNNWREFVKDRYGLEDFSTDIVLGIKKRIPWERCIAIKLFDADNVVLLNGMVLKSSTHRLERHEGNYKPLDPRTAEAIKQRLRVQDI